jgi:DtxR family manganese transport transcriptional regulator
MFISPFQATREHHDRETAEDYTELIENLIQTHGEAKIGWIASAFGVSHVTAVRTVRRLAELGFLHAVPRKPISLTEKGKALAFYAKERHTFLVEFLVQIGVPRQQAEVDIEGAEHHFSEATLSAMRKLAAKLPTISLENPKAKET